METLFGVSLKRLRKARELTLEDLASKTKVSKAFVAAIEKGKKKPPETFLDRISDIFDLSPSQKEDLREKAFLDQNIWKISMIGKGEQARRVFLLFLKGYDKLSPCEKAEILSILRKAGDRKEKNSQNV